MPEHSASPRIPVSDQLTEHSVKFSLKPVLLPLVFTAFIALALFAYPAITLSAVRTQICSDDQMINLNCYDIYIAQGFSEEWVKGNIDYSKLRRIPAAGEGRSIRLKELGPLSKAGSKRDMFRENPPEHFSFFQKFQYHDSSGPRRLKGISLAGIGDNWEIYVNGHLLRSEFDLNADGSIRRHRQRRKVIVYLPSHILLDGSNTLLIHVYGDPASGRFGLFRSRPYLIADYEFLERKFSELFILILMFIFLAVGLYHINLYFLHRQDAYNIFFTLSSIAYFCYFVSRTAFIERFFDDTYVLIRFEYISLYAIFPLFGMLFETILLKRVTVFMKGLAVFNFLLAAGTLVCSMPWTYAILSVWQITAPIPLIYAVFFLFARSFFKDLRNTLKRQNRGLFRALGRTLLTSESGNLVIGGVIIFTCVIFDIVDSIFMARALMVSQYGFSLTILGLEMIQSNRYLSMQNSIKSLNTELNRKMIDLDLAYMQKSASEKRYRFIVEGSNEIFFSLDTNLCLIACNDAINPILFYDPAELIGRPFADLIHSGGLDIPFTIEVLNEKIDQLETSLEPVSFTASFRSEYMDEPVELVVWLQNITFEGEREIIGRMRKQSEDSLLRYFREESQYYVISNYIYLAEDIAHRITRNLVHYVSINTVRLCRTALREVIINSIEHGNLNINFTEKTEAMAQNRYQLLIKQRQSDPRYCHRQVSIRSCIGENEVEFTISDEGEGFDLSNITDPSALTPEQLALPHGRGITIARGVFDTVEYNERGNSVRLTKYLRNGTNTPSHS